MPLVTAGPLWFPSAPNTSTPNLGGTLLIDAAAEKVAMIIEVPRDGTLDKFELMVGAVPQAPASGLRFSFQDPDNATGDPDGAADQFRTVTGIVANTWTVPGLMTSDGTDSGSKRSVTRGQMLACVVEFASFASGDAVNVLLATGTDQIGLHLNCYPDHFTSVWTKIQTRQVDIALKYSDGTYALIEGAVAASIANTVNINTGTSPNEHALLFSVPFPCRVSRAWVRVRSLTTAADFAVVLYDGDGVAVLGTRTVDASIERDTGGGPMAVTFPSDVVLIAGTSYRLAVKPLTVNNISVYNWQLANAAHMDTYEGGAAASYSERTGAGAWTNVSTKRFNGGVRIIALDDGLTPAAFVTSSIGITLPNPPTIVVPA